MPDILGGRYRIEQKLAAGGFGAIYRATDLTVGRSVALKVLHKELAIDGSIVARFRREAAALAKLKNPHTLTLYDVGDTGETLYLVTELLRGVSLHDVFEETGPLEWRRMAKIARGVCSSLREAHALGIVHRDLKPENIVLETHALDVDYVKVIDFGIAKILAKSELAGGDLTRHGQTIGTFDYMAPEQLIGGQTTKKSDIYTLGVVIYEMVSGKRPYGDSKGPAQMLMALLNGAPTPLTGVPPELARVVMRCVSREPQDRPDVDELDNILERLLDDGAFTSDADETTLVDGRIPQAPRASTRGPIIPHSSAKPSRTTLPRGSAAQLNVSGELALEVKPVLRPVAVPNVVIREESRPQPWARGSEVEMAPMPAMPATHPSVVSVRGSTPAIAPVAVRFDVPRGRLAAGTSPIVDEPIVHHVDAPVVAHMRTREPSTPNAMPSAIPAAPERAGVAVIRFATIALCLFGVGFIVALALASL